MTSLYNTTTNKGFSWLGWAPPWMETHISGASPFVWAFYSLGHWAVIPVGSTLFNCSDRAGRAGWEGAEGLWEDIRQPEHHSPCDERRLAGPSPPHSPALLQSECWLTLSCVQAWELSPTSPPHSLAFCHWKDQLLQRALELSLSCRREVSVPRALITKNRNFRGLKRYCIPSVSIEKQQEKSVDCS